GPATAVPLLLLRRDGVPRAHARPFGLADPRNHGHRAAADWRQRIWLLSYSICIDLHDVAAGHAWPGGWLPIHLHWDIHSRLLQHGLRVLALRDGRRHDGHCARRPYSAGDLGASLDPGEELTSSSVVSPPPSRRQASMTTASR